MRLTLYNFGCFADNTFELDSNFMLLSGSNGAGKSSVFKAICYALYGKNKTLRYGESSSSVALELNNIVIKRVSKPMKLLLTKEKKTYEDDKAQCMIEDLIGMTWEQFSLCVWVGSISKASLATITPMERYNVIRTMVSNTEESQKDSEKIANYEKLQREEQVKLKSQETTLLSTKKDFSHVTPPEGIEESKESKGSLDLSKEQVPKNLDLKIKKLETELKQYRAKLLNIGKRVSRAEIKSRLKDIELRPDIIEKLTQLKGYLLYAKKKEKQKMDADNFENAKKEYFEDIRTQLEENRELIDKIDEDQLKKKMSETTKRYIAKDNDNPFWDIDPEDISKRLKEASTAKVTSQMKTTKQTCPHCDEMVCIDETDIVKYLKKYDKMKMSITPQELAYLKELEGLTFSFEDVDELYSSLSKAKMKIKECERILAKNVLSPELVRMNKSIGSTIKMPDGYKSKYSIEYLEERIQNLNVELARIDEASEDEEERLKEMLGVQEESEEPEELQDVIKGIEEKLDNLRKKKSNAVAIAQWNEIKDKLSSIDNRIEKCKHLQEQATKTLEAIACLKVKQREAEILSMQNVIDSINTIASDYLSMFFEESISVQISMIKKTRNNTKMSLEMVAQFKGHKYDMDSFSQGEISKINLSFILALNGLNNAPFLLLDEFMANIDKSVIGDVFEVLKELSSQKQIIVIDHNAIEGIFDKIITF